METLVLIVHVLVAVSMIGLILLQQGKGAEMGASFGAGSSQTVFGAAGATSLLTKITAWLALIFMITSLVLAVYARKDVAQRSALVLPASLGQAAPVAPAPVAAPAPVPAAPAPLGNGDIPVLPGTH